jgi:hypothetical protein
LTRLRTTAGPTARLTVKPILGGSVTPSRTSRCPTSSGRPTLLPEPIAALNSVRRRIRAADGSIGYHRRADDGSADQTLTRARPLRRRAASTARPARVRMRSRKPCVFARRRLFGWNVRLLTETPDAGKSPQAAANARLPPQHKVSVRCALPEARAPGTSIARARDACGGRPPRPDRRSPRRQLTPAGARRRNVGKHRQLTFGDHARCVMTLAVSRTYSPCRA